MCLPNILVRRFVNHCLPNSLISFEELLHESSIEPNKHAYINVIISTIITTKRADDFIIAMCNLIQRLTIDSLHIVGDIYDRGPGAHIIMDTLCNYHNFDIQWGNHDILWMGAASGNDSCIANVIRMSMRYGNLGTLEDGYGINLLPLATFAMDTYADDPCTIFMPKMNFADAHYNEKTLRLITQMHKAITIIQFKLEAEIIDRRPEFGMANRKLLEKIDFERGVFVYEGKEYALRDTNFPTVDPADPYRLTEEERELVEKIHYSFMNSEKLKKHMRCLFTYGGMYLVSNSNLLYHASVPLNEDGSFKHVKIRGKEYWGHKLLDKADQLIRTAYFDEEGEEDKEFAMDYIWYMWCVEAPLFDKDKMATFERYFVEDKELHKEKKGYYYTLRNREDICDQILTEFGAWYSFAYYQRSCACENDSRGTTYESQWQAFSLLMAVFKSLSAGNGNCGVYACFIILMVCNSYSTNHSSLVRKPLKRGLISNRPTSFSNLIRNE